MVGYVNGSEVGRIAARANAIKANTNPLRVGVAPWNTSAFPANGRLDHITLFTRALTSPEIRAMYLVQGAWVEERQSAAVTVVLRRAWLGPGLGRNLPAEPRCGAARQGYDTTSRVTGVELGVSTNGGGSYAWKTRGLPGRPESPSGADLRADGRRRALPAPARATDTVGNRETPPRPPPSWWTPRRRSPPRPSRRGNPAPAARPQLLTPWLVGLNGTVNDPTWPQPGAAGRAAYW